MEETLNNLAFLQHVPCTFKLDPVSSLCQTIRIENSIDVFFKKNIYTRWSTIVLTGTYYLNLSQCFFFARNVQQIYATQFAFAAILADGRVVSWGDPASGGDSSGVQDRLRQG